ncbi:helix-turn-helix domain-containing protein [Geitlerinema splendidum]|nr:helix-turn-helix domain-containing protein [Geitlerinema splendidum]
MEKQFFRIQEVAEIIGLGKSMTYKLVLEGHIPSVHLAGCRARRVPKPALEKWIAEQSSNAVGGDSSY